jgi:hypothetical protein
MAQLPSAFNSSQHDTMRDFSPLPTGEYISQITKSEMKPNKKKTGQYLELTFDVIQGEHKGKKFWVRLNLINPSPKAVEIANNELTTIVRAINNGNNMIVEDSQILHGKPLLVAVKATPATNTAAAGNEVTFYKQLNSGASASSGSGGDASPFDDEVPVTNADGEQQPETPDAQQKPEEEAEPEKEAEIPTEEDANAAASADAKTEPWED